MYASSFWKNSALDSGSAGCQLSLRSQQTRGSSIPNKLNPEALLRSSRRSSLRLRVSSRVIARHRTKSEGIKGAGRGQRAVRAKCRCMCGFTFAGTKGSRSNAFGEKGYTEPAESARHSTSKRMIWLFKLLASQLLTLGWTFWFARALTFFLRELISAKKLFDIYIYIYIYIYI